MESEVVRLADGYREGLRELLLAANWKQLAGEAEGGGPRTFTQYVALTDSGVVGWLESAPRATPNTWGA